MKAINVLYEKITWKFQASINQSLRTISKLNSYKVLDMWTLCSRLCRAWRSICPRWSWWCLSQVLLVNCGGGYSHINSRRKSSFDFKSLFLRSIRSQRLRSLMLPLQVTIIYWLEGFTQFYDTSNTAFLLAAQHSHKIVIWFGKCQVNVNSKLKTNVN